MATKKKPTPTAQTKQIWEGVNLNKPELLESIENLTLLDTPAKKQPHATPLLAAALREHYEVVNVLLKNDCSVWSTDDFGRSPLEAFAWNMQWAWLETHKKDLKWEARGPSHSKRLALRGMLCAALANHTVEWMDWAASLGAKIDATPTYKELPNVWLLSQDEWNAYKTNHAVKPESFDVEYSEEWVFNALESKIFDWSYGRIPLELYAIGASDEKKEWCKARGIQTEPQLIPEDYRLLYLRMAVCAPHNRSVPVSSLVALVDSLETFLPTEDEKQWMWLELFNESVVRKNLKLQKEINAYVSETYNVSLVNSVWPYLDQPRLSANMNFAPKPTWRDYHPVNTLVYLAGNNEMLADGTHPKNHVLPDDKPAMAQKARFYKYLIEHLLEMGLSPQFTERGWGYTLLHQAAAAGAGGVAELLCTYPEVDLLQRSGKQQRGKTAREIAAGKGHAKVVSILESAELKKKHAHVTQTSGPKFGDAL